MSVPHARLLLVGLAVVLALGPGAAGALAHGDEEGAMEVGELAMQPARILAQQALAELEVRNNFEEAAVRLDAALESKDTSDVDMDLLKQATEALDGGDPEGAIPLLDQALSKPLGSASGVALHEAGREFEPADRAQEIVAISLGALLVLLGAVLLLRRRTSVA